MANASKGSASQPFTSNYNNVTSPTPNARNRPQKLAIALVNRLHTEFGYRYNALNTVVRSDHFTEPGNICTNNGKWDMDILSFAHCDEDLAICHYGDSYSTYIGRSSVRKIWQTLR